MTQKSAELNNPPATVKGCVEWLCNRREESSRNGDHQVSLVLPVALETQGDREAIKDGVLERGFKEVEVFTDYVEFTTTITVK